jgi:hypothetical protein
MRGSLRRTEGKWKRDCFSAPGEGERDGEGDAARFLPAMACVASSSTSERRKRTSPNEREEATRRDGQGPLMREIRNTNEGIQNCNVRLCIPTDPFFPSTTSRKAPPAQTCVDMGEFIDYSKRIKSARSTPQHSPPLDENRDEEVGAKSARSTRGDDQDEQHLQPPRRPSRKKSRSSSRYRTAEEDEDGEVNGQTGEVEETGQRHFLVRSSVLVLVSFTPDLSVRPTRRQRPHSTDATVLKSSITLVTVDQSPRPSPKTSKLLLHPLLFPPRTLTTRRTSTPTKKKTTDLLLVPLLVAAVPSPPPNRQCLRRCRSLSRHPSRRNLRALANSSAKSPNRRATSKPRWLL